MSYRLGHVAEGTADVRSRLDMRQNFPQAIRLILTLFGRSP